MSHGEVSTVGRDLVELEAVIEAGMETFVEVGAALLEIRDRRMYRETHATFEDYCRERWSMSRTHANRLVGASETVASLAPTGAKPRTERQVRPLTKLPVEHRPEAWTRAVEIAGGDPTAEQVKEAVREVANERIGPPSTRQGVKPERQAIRAREAFDRAFGAVVLACSASESVFVPVMTAEEADRFAAELERAVRGVHRFKANIKESVR